MEKRDPSHTVGGNVNWYTHYGEQYGGSLKNQKQLLYDPAILFLSIYLEKNMAQKDTCTPVCFAALFTIARTWKQPKYPLREEQIKKMWYVYAMGYYSAVKKNEIRPFTTTWMDLESVVLSTVNQTEKKKHHMTSVISGI